MEPVKTEQEAWIAFLSDEFNAVSVEVDGGFVVVRRCCSDCKHYMTDKTKHCLQQSSVGCWKFKYKGGIYENSSDRR